MHASSWGHAHSSDVWLQPDSLLNSLHSESPLLDLIIWGRFEGCSHQGFSDTSKGEDVVCKKGFYKLISLYNQILRSLFDPMPAPPPAFVLQKQGPNYLAPVCHTAVTYQISAPSFLWVPQTWHFRGPYGEVPIPTESILPSS